MERVHFVVQKNLHLVIPEQIMSKLKLLYSNRRIDILLNRMIDKSGTI